MGLAGLRAAQRRPAAVPVNPARRKAAMAVLRTAAMTWADVPAAEPLGIFAHGDITDIVQQPRCPSGRGRRPR